MNKKEKFYKNLSEFNIQEKPKVEKVEFKNIKTLEKLTEQLKSAISKLDDSKIKSEIVNYNKVNSELKQALQEEENKWEQVKNASKQVELAKEELEDKQKEHTKVEKKLDTAKKKQDTAAKKVFNLNDKYIANFKKGEAIADKLEQAMFDVQEGAKKLGVRISVNQYEASLNSFYNNERDPLSKLDFDY